jgi:radical SAM superfamily enzyme YgiQ (UPF0313 family)
MKVLLINPPYPFEESPTPPFGLISLAAFLIEKGFEVRIDDFIITPCTDENMKATIRDFNPDVIGATGVTMNIKKGLSILSKYRDLKPEAVFVMGGPHVTFDADAILRDNPFIDYIVRGEGELTFVELLDAIRSRQARKALTAAVHSERTELAVHNEQRPFIEDINTFRIRAPPWSTSANTGASGSRSTCHHHAAALTNVSSASGARWVGRKVRYFDVTVASMSSRCFQRWVSSRSISSTTSLPRIRRAVMAVCDEIIPPRIEHEAMEPRFARVDTALLSSSIR